MRFQGGGSALSGVSNRFGLERKESGSTAASGVAEPNGSSSTTMSSAIPNLKYSFSDSPKRVLSGGWTREATVRQLPVSTEISAVNMQLKPGGIRELHWHKEAEWGYVLAGGVQITAVDTNGHSFIDDLSVGDIWYFPEGIGHSLQGLADGCELLIVFDDGNFSATTTFQITDWFAHTPKDVLAKNFGVAPEAFANLPTDVENTRYAFAGSVPAPVPVDVGREQHAPVTATRHSYINKHKGTVPLCSLSYRMLAQDPIETPGGKVRIADSSNFPIAKRMAAALIDVEPGGLRELHWHTKADEWQYYLAGEARMTVFAADGKARTFDYGAGDVGYVPLAMGHYIENIGDEPLRFLEMFRSDEFEDVSLAQWMALTPQELVRAHLNLDENTVATLSPQKPYVVRHQMAEQ